MAAKSGILGLGSRLYPVNMKRILNKDLTRFMQSLSRECQNGASEKGSASRLLLQVSLDPKVIDVRHY